MTTPAESLLHAPRGRVKLADLAPGERYFGVYSATGRCVYRTRNADEANETASRNPDRLSVTAHTKPVTP